jgi:putative hydrolase of the HAD superfamily
MILIFDLDDTLYPEETFVKSGFEAVALWLNRRYGWDARETVLLMDEILIRQGRGTVFDEVLKIRGAFTKKLVKQCVGIYRNHVPKLSLSPTAVEILTKWRGQLYLVTDGHKIAQRNKIQALGLGQYFKRTFVTSNFGYGRAKPSTYCFNKIREMENCRWQDLAYIGDNPAKDFVNLNAMGCVTIRVLTGAHRHAQAKPGHDAQHSIGNLNQLPNLLAHIEGVAEIKERHPPCGTV